MLHLEHLFCDLAILGVGVLGDRGGVHFEITAPASAIGDITGDLATKRARINGNNALPGQLATVSALVPLAEISDYQTRLKALTGGQGTYAMELSHYGPAPPRRQHELMQAYRPRAEEE